MKRLTVQNKSKLRQIRHARVRKVLLGNASEPRLSVFRSLKGIVAQLIDDSSGKTLCYADTRSIKPDSAAPSPKLWRVGDKASTGKEKKAGDRSGKVAASYLLGQMLAEKAKAKGISKIKFDRAGYKYHGRVKALAEGAREGGLIF